MNGAYWLKLCQFFITYKCELSASLLWGVKLFCCDLGGWAFVGCDVAMYDIKTYHPGTLGRGEKSLRLQRVYQFILPTLVMVQLVLKVLLWSKGTL